MLALATTIFISAFLLFQVEPMLAKFILPWFGGSAAVWSAALLFFQLLLLGGYLYAYCLIRFVKPRLQFLIHAGLVLISVSILSIVPSAHWKPSASEEPTLRILLLLTATVGLKYTLLASTSPLLQAWYVRTREKAAPYRLFSLSNFGSLLALISYPFLVEPRLALSLQARLWSGGYMAFAAFCIYVAFRARGDGAPKSEEFEEQTAAPSARQQFLWIGLAACASTFLLAVTTLMTQNVAPIPLLWVLPLGLYLLSFVLCFESHRIYRRAFFLPLLIVSLALFAYTDYLYEENISVWKLIAALSAALFICCMVCHGELARSKPHPRYLTGFYLMVSIGGAAGGLFVALAAPHLFDGYFELPFAMAACALLVTASLWNARFWRFPPIAMRTLALTLTLILTTYLLATQTKAARVYTASVRNFYGVLRVHDIPAAGEIPAVRELIHGTITHGTQLAAPGSERIATSYFGTGSGISRALRALGESGPLKIGILGLGAGVTATLARAGDTLHYYEINPLVVDISRKYFGFYSACPASKEVLLGDGRLVLESLPNEGLDFLAMDAFSSDSVPIHLLTREAYSTYLRHLKPSGVLAINISNRYLDLEPVVAQAALEFGLAGYVIEDDGYDQPYYMASTWALLSRSPGFFRNRNFDDSDLDRIRSRPGFRTWTDDYSNIVQILK